MGQRGTLQEEILGYYGADNSNPDDYDKNILKVHTEMEGTLQIHLCTYGTWKSIYQASQIFFHGDNKDDEKYTQEILTRVQIKTARFRKQTCKKKF